MNRPRFSVQTLITVRCCGDCPFRERTDRGVSACGHPEGAPHNIEPSDRGVPPPGWCPLRGASVEVRLDARVSE
jgi:hypothetical protein